MCSSDSPKVMISDTNEGREEGSSMDVVASGARVPSGVSEEGVTQSRVHFMCLL